MSEDAELLRRYATDRSESAFEELILRHVDVVYSAALRLVGGHTHQAEDVTQEVFSELARRSERLVRHPALAGWLYTTTRLMALRSRRTEWRRRAREQKANVMNEILREPAAEPDWDHLRPVLEDAMHGLGEEDRLAVLLRYFQNKSVKEVGAVLRLNENAARMRVERALDKLRAKLARKGVTSTASALAVVLSTNAVTAAPSGFVATLAGASLAGAMTGAGSTLAILKFMSMTKLKATIISAVIAAGLATWLVVQHRSFAKLLAERATLQQQQAVQLAELDSMRKENGRLTKLEVNADELERLRRDRAELVRLRGEVTRVRQEKDGSTATHTPRNATAQPSTELPEWNSSQLTNAGRTTPRDALQTVLWAVTSQKPEEMIGSVVMDANDAQLEEAYRRFIAGSEAPPQFDRFRVLSEKYISPDEVQINLAADSQAVGDTQKAFTLKKVDGEWKAVVFSTRDANGTVIYWGFENRRLERPTDSQSRAANPPVPAQSGSSPGP
jgi:RNA polymerase sigma factor (sigma-70 family)